MGVPNVPLPPPATTLPILLLAPTVFALLALLRLTLLVLLGLSTTSSAVPGDWEGFGELESDRERDEMREEESPSRIR
jgi:hypothetical protein